MEQRPLGYFKKGLAASICLLLLTACGVPPDLPDPPAPAAPEPRGNIPFLLTTVPAPAAPAAPDTSPAPPPATTEVVATPAAKPPTVTAVVKKSAPGEQGHSVLLPAPEEI